MITSSGIEAFLAICRAKSISAAAEELFVSQSALSVRLKTLEDELGTTLFQRRKGHHEINLTKSGEEFYEIARDYERVMDRIARMRKNLNKTLYVSSLNSLGAYIMPEIYERFMEAVPDVGLEIQDQDFRAACKSILQGRTELAFNTDDRVPERIVAMPVFSEAFALVTSEKSAYPQTVSAEMLNVKNEVYVDWYNGFEAYHTDLFGNQMPQLRLDIMSQLEIFVKKPNNWAIVPVSVARGLAENEGIRIVETDFSLPRRTVYCLHSAEAKLEGHSVLFLKCMQKVLSRTENVECLLPEVYE